MNRKGFTLIELLAVIIILTLMLLLVVPIITNIIVSSRERMYDVKISNIEAAAEIWAADNTDQLPDEEGEVLLIQLSDLTDGGYIEEDVTDPTTGEPFPGELIIEIKLERNSYRYNVQ